ncbi:MAG TPA: hypothetical protein VHL53_11385 [Acidimicrobiia bacterium]|nr:hypothetical protein [Acidimicrobiia bacterium]
MGVAVAIGILGLVGVHPAEGRADAAGATAAPAVAPVVDLPIPPRPAPAVIVEDTTTTTAGPETTTTTTAPPETTTTTAPAPPPTTAPPKPKPSPPRVAASGPAALAEVEAIADSSGWDWRAAGVRFSLGFYPQDCCHWGVYESAKSVIWIGPTAFDDPGRLRYVVLHELAHAWQYRQNRFPQFTADYSAWGFTSLGPALEAGADCLANVWGAAGGHYWNCTAAARALAARRFSGDWR